MTPDTRQAIAAAYEARESAADRMRGPDHDAIEAAVADEFGVGPAEVRDVMLHAWFGVMGAG